jgi:hypothetical protein
MFTFETVVRDAPEARRVSAAFFKFVESHPLDQDVPPILRSEAGLDFDRISVVLGSEEAVLSFAAFLARFPI